MLPMMALMRAPSTLHNYRVGLDHLDRLQTQKSPQGFHFAGSQDFDEGSGNPQPRILVGWRSLNRAHNAMKLIVFLNSTLDRVPKRVPIIGSHTSEQHGKDNECPALDLFEMILEESVHTVQFWFLCINFNYLCGVWFEAGCTLVCTFGEHLSQDGKKRPEPLCIM